MRKWGWLLCSLILLAACSSPDSHTSDTDSDVDNGADGFVPDVEVAGDAPDAAETDQPTSEIDQPATDDPATDDPVTDFDAVPADTDEVLIDTDNAVDDAVVPDIDMAPFVCDVHQEGNTVGLRTCVTGTAAGYTLFAPLFSNMVFLIDNLGNEAHRWETQFVPGMSAYLLENGDLLMAGVDDRTTSQLTGGGQGGVVQRIAWDGTVLWEYTYISDLHRQHHDILPMPNGNVLLVAWEYKTPEEAIAAGRDPQTIMVGRGFWPDQVIEVQPQGNSGNIVWEWHVWDHLVQNLDPTKPHYADPADHPERIDVNFNLDPLPDWSHVNAIDYNEDLDQIVLTVWGFNEVWVIDHTTTTEEAADSTGGHHGKGGDLLYRWGNPRTYGQGTLADQRLFKPHAAHWIAEGLPGAVNILVFNNIRQLDDETYFSSVDEFEPPTLPDGSYGEPTGAWAPAAPAWSYIADPPGDFYAMNFSNAQRLSNGNTLICNTKAGHFFEVLPSGDVVWDYINPVTKENVIHHDTTTPPSENPAFRIYRYPPDHPGLVGKDLTPKGTIE